VVLNVPGHGGAIDVENGNIYIRSPFAMEAPAWR
jgi:hypothetical protein